MFFTRGNSHRNDRLKQRPKVRTIRPHLEVLEDRITPDGSATVSNLGQLQNAIMEANANMTGVFTINLNPNTYTLNANTPLKLDNPNAGTTIILQETPGSSGAVVLDGNNASRVLQVNGHNNTVILDNLTIEKGKATDDPTATGAAAGAGLLNNGGNVYLSHVNVSSKMSISAMSTSPRTRPRPGRAAMPWGAVSFP